MQINLVEEGTKPKIWKVLSKAKTSVTYYYLPELDRTPELEPDDL